jgi:excisionase family DNA binding protein
VSEPIDELAEAALAFALAILAARSEPELERNLSVAEAAARIGVSRSTIYNMMNRGELAYVRIGRRRRRLIPQAEVRRFTQRSGQP